MKQIRKSVFETNSSSTHSLVVDEHSSLLEQPFSEAETQQGYITVCSGEFGWDNDVFYDPGVKLSYLYTDICSSGNDIRRLECMDILKEAVKQHTGLDVVFDTSDCGYIDHQSAGLCDDVWTKGIDGVIDFVFRTGSHLKTGNDNE